MQVQIVFTASGSSSEFGNFAPGDRLRCSAEQAEHFVSAAGCAKYVDQPAAEGVRPDDAPAAPITKPGKKRGAA